MAIKFVSGKSVRKRHLVCVLYGPPIVGKDQHRADRESPEAAGRRRRVSPRADPVPVPRRDDRASFSVWDDIANPEASDFADADTAVVDTAGSAIDKAAAHIIRSDPKRGSGGTLDLKGYGILKGTFVGWLNRLRECGVDVVLLAHGAEEQRGDDMVDRIIAAGSSKQEIYQQADLIGRMYVESDGSRWVAFDPTAGSFGKNCGMEKSEVGRPDAGPDPTRRDHQRGAHPDQRDGARRSGRGGAPDHPAEVGGAAEHARADDRRRYGACWTRRSRRRTPTSGSSGSRRSGSASTSAGRPSPSTRPRRRRRLRSRMRPRPPRNRLQPAPQAADPPPPPAEPAPQPPPGVRVGATAQPRAQRVPVPQADPPPNEQEAAAALQAGPVAKPRPIGGGEDPVATAPVTDPDQPEIW